MADRVNIFSPRNHSRNRGDSGQKFYLVKRGLEDGPCRNSENAIGRRGVLNIYDDYIHCITSSDQCWWNRQAPDGRSEVDVCRGGLCGGRDLHREWERRLHKFGQVRISESSARIPNSVHYAGKPIGVAIRTATELSAILEQNPFPSNEPRHTYVIFLDERPPRGALDHATGRVDEDMRLGKQEIYVAYPNGMGRSKLRIPAAKMGTARNLNTVAALVEIAARK